MNMIESTEIEAGPDQGLSSNTGVRSRIFEICAVFGAGFLVLFVGLKFAGENMVAKQAAVWLANIAMISGVIISLRTRGEGIEHVGVQRIETSTRAGIKLFGASLLAFLLAISGFVVGSIIMANITGIPESADMSSYDFMSGNLPVLILVLAGVLVASSFGEELLYRGFLITRIAEILGGEKRAWLIAAAISSVAFGLAHYEWGPMGMVQTTFMGAALAFAWFKSKRNLWVVILAHAYMDTILMIQMYLA